MSVGKRFSLRQKAGAIIYDIPRLLWALRPGRSLQKRAGPWVRMRNRNETLTGHQEGGGVLCNWKWTSDIHVAKVYPIAGRALLRRALRDWPIAFGEEPRRQCGDIAVSFIIGHRGLNRLPHLLTTLRTVASQMNVSVECVVVEQVKVPEIRALLPDWVRYLHTPPANPDMPYCRAWAFNEGASIAKGKLLILHDNDIIVPRDYSAELMKIRNGGYEVINLKRFIFYLDRPHSEGIVTGQLNLAARPPVSVRQNLEAGGSLAITRDAYFAIGGFDEDFVGWGGEDNEFWERASTLRVWPFGSLPFIHLWHESQPEKTLGDEAPGMQRYWEATAVPPQLRIEHLVRRRGEDALT